MDYALLIILLLPLISVPFVYMIGKKNPKGAAITIALISLISIILLLTTAPTVMDSPSHEYIESYEWIPILHSSLALQVDGVSLPISIITSVLILSAALFSIDYMKDRKSPAVYYTLLTLLSAGLTGVFITSNLLLFYFCWELMLVPSFFILGNWGYKEPYKAAFKFFIFTHAGAVFVLLGIGTIYMVTGSLDIAYAKVALPLAQPDLVKWILISLTAGFAVKMAVVPVHMWLPDAHSEAPAPMSALLSGVIIGAGAYAILRFSLETVLPAVIDTEFKNAFLHGLAIFGIISAFLGSLIALVETDIKRIIAYSSIAHMGYILFGLSLFPFQEAITGTVLHIVNHAVSKGLLFLSAGVVMKQLEIRDIRQLGGLAKAMPIAAISTTTAALSIAGIPPFACFISEFLIFVGAFQVIGLDNFFFVPTVLMLISTILSLAYSLRYVSQIYLGPIKFEKARAASVSMRIPMIILMILIVLLGIWPGLFIQLITTVNFMP